MPIVANVGRIAPVYGWEKEDFHMLRLVRGLESGRRAGRAGQER